MTTVLILQHHAADAPGAIARVLEAHGVAIRYARMHEGEAVPDAIGDARAIVSMGGPMSANDADDARAHPFLAAELRLLAHAIANDVPVLGVCLGAQMLARALGGNVRTSARKEIGWLPASLTEHAQGDPLFGEEAPFFMPFHWHGERVDLPSGAMALARSAATPVQAFRYGRATYGMQFHVEMTPPLVRGMVETFGAELADEGLDGGEIARQGEAYFPAMEQLAERVFSRWIGLIRRG